MAETVNDAKADLLDLIETAINDSLDIYWPTAVGAEHVYRALERKGIIRKLETHKDMLEALMLARDALGRNAAYDAINAAITKATPKAD